MPVSDSTEKPPLPPAYLDTSGTSALTGISESTLEKQRLTGNGIPFIKAGRLVKYAVVDIHCWMAERRRSSTSETCGKAPPALAREQTGGVPASTARTTIGFSPDSASGTCIVD